MQWIDATARIATPMAVGLFVVVNSVFAVGVLATRNRGFVDRWTRPVLMADAALVFVAIGAPVAAIGLKLVAKGLIAVGALPGRLIHGK